MLGFQLLAELCLTLVPEASKAVLNLGFTCLAVALEVLVGAGFEFFLDL